MNIKIAAEKTGLTKKAIKYYESEGLISPIKKSDNNYREYCKKDIVKLNLIGALRMLNIPIIEIKSVVEGKKGISEIMQDAFEKINKDIGEMEKTRSIISSLIESNVTDYEMAGQHIKRLRETLDLSVYEKEELLSSMLLRIFPGRFGEYIGATYEPFLKITIDNEEKRSNWIKLLELLDDFEQIDEIIYFNNYINDNYSGASWKMQYRENVSQGVNDILNSDNSMKDKMASKAVDFIENINFNDNLEKVLDIILSMDEEILKSIDRFKLEFEEYLSRINEEYKRYKESREEIVNLAGKQMRNKRFNKNI